MKARFTRKDTANTPDKLLRSILRAYTPDKLLRSILRAYVLIFLGDLLIPRIYKEFMLGSDSFVTSDHV